MIGQVARPTPGGGRRVAGGGRPAGASAGTDRHHAAVPRRRTSSHPAARRAAVVVAVVAIAVAAVALALSLGDDERAPALTRAELSAEAFADSMGVVIHLNYVDTAYGRRAEVVARLRELGVRHVREAMPTPPVGAQADGLRALRALASGPRWAPATRTSRRRAPSRTR